MPNKIIIVCYSLPVNVKFNSEAQTYEFTVHNGGLQNGLQGVKDCSSFLWLGWPGDEIEAQHQAALRQKLLTDHNFFTLFFDKFDFQNSYLNYCFLHLHPIKHNLVERSEYKKSWWYSYAKVNEKFAKQTLELLEPGDLVWIQDFNLAMVPYYMRKYTTESTPNFKLGFFCHTNFPIPGIFNYIPEARRLLESLSSCDLVGFHCYTHEKNFRDSCSLHGIDPREDHKTATIPFGINLQRYDRFLRSSKTEGLLRELKDKYAGKFVFFGCERADYIKSIDLKLKSFDLFFESNPDLVGKCVLIQFSVPCKLFLRQMRDYASSLSQLAIDINEKYVGTPIEYKYQSLDFESLMAYYLLADCCVITSIADGLNLIAYEYVYAQEKKKPSPPGVLILSRFAGAADYLDTPFKINPIDLESLAATYRQVFELTDQDRFDIQARLLKAVEVNTAENWKKQFFEKIEFSG